MLRALRRLRWPMSHETRIARFSYRCARARLAEVAEESVEETDAYLAANDWVIAAEQRLPWWKRLDIDLTA
ncbi:hypothetical protein OG989_03980 [Micromonospora sp. NBC_01740]|uniref:hypothetical protein n=1 Tax=Micromonospora sp. NBC_01740 TaxID=2975986 RepID=UPI002E11D369|nr:hypothetical protein OG989_03980 [Micromonospora sp. NBC_01740]